MGGPERSLTTFGAEIAELADALPEARLDTAAGEERFLAAARTPPAGTQRRRLLFALAAAVLAVGIALLSIEIRQPRPSLAFAVGSSGHAEAGGWFASPSGVETPVTFSDGSRIRLAGGGQARVTAVDADGAEIALERGSLDLAVIHRAATSWRVHVGPFLVRVVGTRFTTSWEPEEQRFGVALQEGAVRVSGPVVGEERVVRAGERLEVSVVTGTLVASRTSELESAPRTAPEPPFTAAPTPSTEPAAKAATAAALPPPSWRVHARNARYREALAAAEASGFESIVASASAADLRALADAARLAGGARRAEQAERALLARFPASAEAGDGMFMLGRAAQDQRGDAATATAWFERYLTEHPSGRFAEEASGRLVELAERAGDASRAKAAAKRYLDAHPKGAHATFAERVLGASTR